MCAPRAPEDADGSLLLEASFSGSGGAIAEANAAFEQLQELQSQHSALLVGVQERRSIRRLSLLISVSLFWSDPLILFSLFYFFLGMAMQRKAVLCAKGEMAAIKSVFAELEQLLEAQDSAESKQECAQLRRTLETLAKKKVSNHGGNRLPAVRRPFSSSQSPFFCGFFFFSPSFFLACSLSYSLLSAGCDAARSQQRCTRRSCCSVGQMESRGMPCVRVVPSFFPRSTSTDLVCNLLSS